MWRCFFDEKKERQENASYCVANWGRVVIFICIPRMFDPFVNRIAFSHNILVALHNAEGILMDVRSWNAHNGSGKLACVVFDKVLARHWQNAFKCDGYCVCFFYPAQRRADSSSVSVTPYLEETISMVITWVN